MDVDEFLTAFHNGFKVDSSHFKLIIEVHQIHQNDKSFKNYRQVFYNFLDHHSQKTVEGYQPY
ncbi:uncharacterized protein SPAPADRAFT_61324 [Spathaspora passalidarum NRRL Y-27907]|uniref:Uncharacterized protein n=1 Tax=Spathaspora passalidarum (strain NRRL Y-27907 / 11-Y1) TaxID=619300 RepID=G3APS4_SPAPN|nr:uncharacterized protein SPAPADRAFT_61324 [Spathaspora passalidarum NRRL Y-27907]EGW32245.1 hypothetical protein SPAPADRAFT_61324 [Spathaspora passalidarum NRRL Y-27907]